MDGVILLAAGRLVYSGPTDGIVAYFTSPPLSYVAHDDYTTPAQLLLDITHGIEAVRPENG